MKSSTLSETGIPRLEIHVIVSSLFNQNCFIIHREESRQAVVFDPGLDVKAIQNCLERRGLTVAAILNTHGHADHIAGNGALKEYYPSAPLLIGEKDALMLQDPEANLSAGFDFPLISPPADRTVREGDTVEVADLTFEVFDIPGHSPGHVIFLLRGTPHRVFGGDVLFRMAIGRWDFPGGDLELLLQGIREKLLILPDDTIVYPGHEDCTTIGFEREHNPFLSTNA